MMRAVRTAAALILVVLLGVVILANLPGTPATPAGSRGAYLEEGARATGAVNIVSAIYLGYRAYDTLGEAVVLLLAVTSVAFFAGKEH